MCIKHYTYHHVYVELPDECNLLGIGLGMGAKLVDLFNPEHLLNLIMAHASLNVMNLTLVSLVGRGRRLD